MTWCQGMYGRGQRFPLVPPLTLVRVRPVGGPGEWNIKKNLFSVVEVRSASGLLELAVPKGSVQLVESALNALR